MSTTVGIIGLGLIGGSFAKALKKENYKVYGMDKNIDTIEKASVSGLFEGVTDDLNIFLEFPCDLIYLCVPVDTALVFLDKMCEKNISTLITDACSTKATIQKKAISLELNFCGGHPIAGKETSGFENSSAEMLENAFHIIMETDNRKNHAFLKHIHKDIGMNIKSMTAEEHDKIFGAVSHFPHLISFLLMELILQKDKNMFEFTGGGFKDFTRIAGSDPKMWSSIFIDNKSTIADIIDDYIKLLLDWKEDINAERKDAVFEKIKRISAYRQCLYEKF